MNNKEIMEIEMESLMDDILKVYNQSGKRVTGQFEKDLNTEYTVNGSDIKAELFGNATLGGRGATKKGHQSGTKYLVERIKEWIEQKGIVARDGLTVSSLAWAISSKIHKSGTNKDYHIDIYDTVLTAQRIDDIIKKVSRFNAGAFVNDITVELKKLTKGI